MRYFTDYTCWSWLDIIFRDAPITKNYFFDIFELVSTIAVLHFVLNTYDALAINSHLVFTLLAFVDRCIYALASINKVITFLAIKEIVFVVANQGVVVISGNDFFNTD